VVEIDHLILKVKDLKDSIDFYTAILGFTFEGMEGPFALIRVNPSFQLLLDPSGIHDCEHFAFAVSRNEFELIFDRIKLRGIPYGPTFDSVGSNSDLGEESGARGIAPTLYFSDPNRHLLEIRWYENS